MVAKSTKEEKTGRSSATLVFRNKDFSQCYCLPEVTLFWVYESILESILGRKKKIMRTNCKGRAFSGQYFKKRMQTACYFVWPTLKLREKNAEKCQSMNLALLSFGPSSQFYKWGLPSNLCLQTSHLIYEQSQDHLKKTRCRGPSPSCTWGTVIASGIENWSMRYSRTRQNSCHSAPLSASAPLCELEATSQRSSTGWQHQPTAFS